MKKLIIIVLILTACSKLDFKYDSKIDYSSFKKAYVLEIYNNVRSFTYSEQDMIYYLCDELNRKSGFKAIYNYYDNPNLSDSVLPSEYLVLRLTVTEGEYKYKEIDHDNGDVSFYYEANITVLCEAYSNNTIIYKVEKTGEYNYEFDYDSEDNFDEVKNIALEHALEEIAKYYTKSYSI